MELVFATHNDNKLKEIQSLFPKGYRLISLTDIKCTEDIEETGITLKENALIKADYVKKKYNYDCFADDTGLEIDFLKGAPGIYSARYAGNERDNEKNILKVLNELEGQVNRDAQFRTVIVLCIGTKSYFFEGIVKGTILHQPQGEKGFGYDSIFMPENCDRSFAEMSREEKNKISHRYIAFRKMLLHFQNL